MRVYLDVCCLNRPFDDQSQERIQLEAENGRADVFLTTDDRLQRRVSAINPPLTVRVANPLIWLLEQQI
ncbi:MAG: hypothetical protein IAE79_02240 [Anaerolinea sp.]|nr:hypothetical protein [Anaerolinea sp.]